MKNLEQIRAKNALAWQDQIGATINGGQNTVKKIPVMILNNGIIATAAFALEKEREEKGGKKPFTKTFEAIIYHLNQLDIDIGKKQDIQSFIQHLIENCSG